MGKGGRRARRGSRRLQQHVTESKKLEVSKHWLEPSSKYKVKRLYLSKKFKETTKRYLLSPAKGYTRLKLDRNARNLPSSTEYEVLFKD